MSTKNIGKVVQVIGPVLDIRFQDGQLPELLSAIEIQSGDRKIVAEVAQHIGDNVARCISMNATDGMVRGMDAVDTGGPITVPVGDKCLGRIFNLLGRAHRRKARARRRGALAHSPSAAPALRSRKPPPRSWKPASR